MLDRLPRVARWLLPVGLLIAFSIAGTAVYLARYSPMLRDRVVAALNSRFESQVQLGSLQVRPFPRPAIDGTRLELRHNGRTDVPPLISIRDFSGDATLRGLFQSPLHLRTVHLTGMTIHVPPGGVGSPSAPASASSGSTAPPSTASGSPHADSGAPSLSIDRIEAGSVWLEIASRNPLKPPRIFDIHQLVLTNFRPDAPAAFRASLTNAIPTGEVTTEGMFGPYFAREPGHTAISGRYTLESAQLDDIKGLDGTLSSTGQYDGNLERLVVRGETRSSDFAIDVASQAVPLTTTFTAVVDGTNGDTQLERVDATLIETKIQARGAVVRARDVKGRQVALDVNIDEGRIDDILALALKRGQHPLTGMIDMQARLVIPAGDEKVIQRMQLAGGFALSKARFTSYNVQKQINTLSQRGRGDEGGDDRAESVVSNMSGRFVMREGRISFSHLAFSVPGARVELAGTYGVIAETFNFRGHLLLDASLADTTSGLKALAARLVQPFFRRPGGGSKLPIRITGTRVKPSFGLDLRRAFLPG